MGQKEKLHVLCNFFFCHYVFKKLSAAVASESVYMRERVNVTCFMINVIKIERKMWFHCTQNIFLDHPMFTVTLNNRLVVWAMHNMNKV